MATTTSSQLANALHERRLIRFWRRFEDSPIRGYVLDVGPKFFLLALVSERIWFDGFECFRVSDVKQVRPDPYAQFTETVLQKRGERVPRKPRVSVATLEEMVVSASRAYPLVTLHREQVDSDVCWIGRILSVERSYVSLLEISPDASWNVTSSRFRLSEITRVNFGGDYENALHLVGGDPAPAMPNSKSADELSAQKAQQDANRAAYMKRRFTPAELRQQQQESLAALARFAPRYQKQGAHSGRCQLLTWTIHTRDDCRFAFFH